MLAGLDQISFYHGTSDWHARRIIAGGVSDYYLQRIGALEVAKQLYTLALARVSNWTELGKLFHQHGSKFWAAGPIGLKNVSDGLQKSSAAYGSFYVTLSPQIAVSYATRNQAGSELLSIIEDTIMVLRACNEPRINHVLDHYPELRACLAHSHRPVVLEFSRLSLASLEKEDGGSVVVDGGMGEDVDYISFCLEMVSKGVRLPSAFRVKRMPADSLVGVYSIPDPVPKNLCDPSDPLAHFDNAAFRALKLKPISWMQSS